MCSFVTDENVERDYERQLHNIVIFDVGRRVLEVPGQVIKTAAFSVK